MKTIVFIASIGVLAMYAVYLQLQINDLQGVELVATQVNDVSKKFGGGPYIPVNSPALARTESAVSAPSLVSEATPLVADGGIVRNMGEFIDVDSYELPIEESSPRSIGEYRDVDDESARPEALVEPRNIGEYLPVNLADG